MIQKDRNSPFCCIAIMDINLMLNLILAVLVQAIVALASTTNYLKGPLAVGGVVVFLITSLSSKAQAAVGYKDPLIERFGPHYTSWDVFVFYNISPMDIVGTLLAFLLAICILVWVAKRI